MTRRNALIAVSLILLGTTGARGQDLASLDPKVQHVVSGGRWSSSAGTGWYRAIIRTGDVEHVVSDLSLQWIQEQSTSSPTRNGSISIVSSVQVTTNACHGRLDNPMLTTEGTTWRLVVLCTDTRGSEKPFRLFFALAAPGVYSRVDPE